MKIEWRLTPDTPCVVNPLVGIAEERLYGARVRSVICKGTIFSHTNLETGRRLTLAGLCDDDDISSALWQGFFSLALNLEAKREYEPI
jgi:hypothetical protein